MSTQPLVPTVFSTGAKDTLAAVDTYKQKPGAKPVNSIQALTEKMGFDVSSILGGLNASAALGAVMKLGAGGQLNFDKNVLTARLLATSSKITNSYRSLGEQAKSAALGGLDVGAAMKAQIGGVTSLVDSYQIESAKGLGNFLSDYTGDKNLCTFEDGDAVGGLIGGLVSEGSNLGVGNVFTSLTSGISDVSIVSKAAQTAMPKLLANGDLSTIFEISGSPAGKGMGMLFPDLSKDLGAAFGVKLDRGGQDLFGDFNKYLGTMNNIFGDWDKFEGNGDGLGVNLLRMMGSSRSLQDVVLAGIKNLTDDNDRQKQYGLMSAYKETTVEAEIKRFFPKTTLVSQSNPRQVTKKSNTVDPRTLLQLGAMGGIILTA